MRELRSGVRRGRSATLGKELEVGIGKNQSSEIVIKKKRNKSKQTPESQVDDHNNVDGGQVTPMMDLDKEEEHPDLQIREIGHLQTGNPITVEAQLVEDQGNYMTTTPYESVAGLAELQHQDILLNIVVRLPVKSILRFRCVSKAWCKLLKDPNFVRQHRNHATQMNIFSVMMLYYPTASYVEPDIHTLAYSPSLHRFSELVHIGYPLRCESQGQGIVIWGTCNGLVCGSLLLPSKCVVLWNPATKEFKKVPRDEPVMTICQYAFGYDDEIDDFKVVSFSWLDCDTFCQARVYTLKSNSWRRLENVPGELFASDMVKVSTYGATHWLSSTAADPHQVIVSFHFKDERFDSMHLPTFHDKYNVTQLCSLKGSLCLQCFIGDRTDVWEMKLYGVTESWAKLFTFNITFQLSMEFLPLQFVNNDEVLLGYGTDVGYHLDLYDIKCGTSIRLKPHAERDSSYGTSFVYVESLVALNSGTYVGQVDKHSEDDDDSQDRDLDNNDESEEEEQEKQDTETKSERLQSQASPRTIDQDSTNSGPHVGTVEIRDSKDDDNSEEEDERGEEDLTKGFPASSKSVDEARETSQTSRQKSSEIHYVEAYMDLKRRKLDLESRKLDLESRKLDMEHMSMDTSKMNALQLKWWQMCADKIVEKAALM